jgi:hypothetical protein
MFYDDTLGALPLSNNTYVKRAADGSLFLCDSTADWIVHLVDLNADGDANDAGEAVVFFDSATQRLGPY